MKSHAIPAGLLLALLSALHAADPPNMAVVTETDARLQAEVKGWRLYRAKVTDPKRPRVLLIGDSILTGDRKRATATEFHVAPDGDDANPGTDAKPFATLERARDAVRTLRAAGAGTVGSVTVWLKPGIHTRSKTLEFTSADSGTEKSPVTFRAGAGGEARLHAGRFIRPADFAPVTKPEVLGRLEAAARGNVLQLDLAALGLKNTGPFPKIFNTGGGLCELFVNDQRMPLSRWPNEGFVTMGKVLDRGDSSKGAGRRGGKFIAREDRVARWGVASGVWLEGYWRVPWEPQTVQVKSIDATTREITFAEPVGGGIGSKYAKAGELGDGKEPWCAVNLLEEIDRPGEWCVDFMSHTLFFWPPTDLARARIFLSDFEQPLVAMRDVSHVTLRGLVMEGGLGNGVEISGGANNLVVGCTFRNLGGSGVLIKGGAGHGVRSSDFHDLGQGGIHLSGGDRKTLSPARHFAVNNDLHHLGLRKKTYAAAIHVGAYGAGDAVGCRVAHNFMHDLPHAAVLYSGNDHLMEFIQGMIRRLQAANPQQPPWSARYPTLATLLSGRRDLPTGNVIENNVTVACYQPLHCSGRKEELAFSTIRNNLVLTAGEAAFADAAGLDFRLRPESAVFKQLPAFKPIPMEQIGLIKDEYRATLPGLGRRGASDATSSPAFDSNTDLQRSNQSAGH